MLEFVMQFGISTLKYVLGKNFSGEDVFWELLSATKSSKEDACGTQERLRCLLEMPNAT